jgi:hypothetical protein
LKHLSITRALVAAAVSVHLLGLKQGIRLQERSVNKAMKRTDTASTAVHGASQALTSAKMQRTVARSTERETRKNRDNFVAAAVAEADSLRRNHNVG